MTAAPMPAAATRPRQFGRRSSAAVLLLPAAIVTFLLLLWPLAFIVQMSFTVTDSFLSPSGPVYSVENYVAMVTRYLPNVFVTIQLAGLAAIVDLIFGFPFAYILVRRVRYRDVVRGLMVFPMFGALYVAFGMRFILLPGGIATPLLELFGIEPASLLYSLPSVVFAMAIFTFPFMVMSIAAALSNLDPTLEEAAACLGARPWQVFARVVIPLTRSGLLAGTLLVFGWSVGTFAEPLLLGSLNEQRALAYTLYQRGVVQTDYGLSSAMGVVLLGLALGVTWILVAHIARSPRGMSDVDSASPVASAHERATEAHRRPRASVGATSALAPAARLYLGLPARLRGSLHGTAPPLLVGLERHGRRGDLPVRPGHLRHEPLVEPPGDRADAHHRPRDLPAGLVRARPLSGPRPEHDLRPADAARLCTRSGARHGAPADVHLHAITRPPSGASCSPWSSARSR